MAAYFGGSSATRQILNEDQIANILGDGDLSEIDDLDDDEEISPFSFFDQLDDIEVKPARSIDQHEMELVDITLSEPTSGITLETIAPGSPSTVTCKLNKTHQTRYKSSRACKRFVTSSSLATPKPVHSSSVLSRTLTISSAGTSTRRRTYQTSRPWKKLPFQDLAHEFTSFPRKEVKNPIDYFNEYMDDEFFEHISNCTNMYHLRNTGKELKTSRAEIMKLFGVHALMGAIPYPRWKMYWRKGISMDKITSTMSRDRFSTLRNALHVVDSDSQQFGDANPLWKVQPMIDQIRNGCYKQERLPGFYSVDEQMIPFTGRCVLHQVVKNKPHPVGLKNFVLTTSNGLMLDFDIYKGAKTMFGADMSLGLGPAVVLHLSRSIPPGSCLYHDRYFTTIPLIEELAKRNLHSTGTIMLNRLPEKSSLKFKEDKRMLRGEYEQKVRGSVTVVKWKDNKSVLLASNCTGSDKSMSVKRWDKKTRSYVDITAPQIVMNYNRHMGGVDVLDQQMEYYRTFIKTKKWTRKVLIHFFDLAIVNAWRAYKIDCEGNQYPRSKILDLLDFRLEIHEILVHVPEKRRAEVLADTPSYEEIPVIPRKYQKTAKPSVSLRYDGYDHLPEFDEIKSPRACQFETCSSRIKLVVVIILHFYLQFNDSCNILHDRAITDYS